MVKMLRSRLGPRHVRLMELLLEARLLSGTTQAELSARLRRPQSYVSNVESGERRLDVIEFLELTEALGCDHLAILARVREVAP